VSNYKYSSDPVKVMWVNPLGYTDFDDPIAELLAEIKDPRTHLEVVSLAQPVHTPHLEYRVYEAMVIADLVRVVRQASLEGFDALAIGCFYDLGLEDARQISGDMVVVAPCQAAVQILTNLCNRFSVLVGQHFWIEQMTDRVRYYGQGDRLQDRAAPARCRPTGGQRGSCGRPDPRLHRGVWLFPGTSECGRRPRDRCRFLVVQNGRISRRVEKAARLANLAKGQHGPTTRRGTARLQDFRCAGADRQSHRHQVRAGNHLIGRASRESSVIYVPTALNMRPLPQAMLRLPMSCAAKPRLFVSSGSVSLVDKPEFQFLVSV